MRALSDALYAKMAGDDVLTALLGQWNGNPSIITFRPVPAEAASPIVLAAETISDVDQDLIRARGREIQRDIAVCGNVGHFDAVEEAAECIRHIFHRHPITIDGHYAASVVARGPITAPTDAGEVGRIVTLTLLIYETS